MRFAPDKVCLAFVLLAFVAIWRVIPQQFEASDPWSYSLRAFDPSHPADSRGDYVREHRLAVTAPVALLYSAFGVNIYTTNLWPLAACLLVVITVWFALPDARSRAVGSILCLLSVPLLEASTSLLPDVIAAAFMGLSSYVLFSRVGGLTGRRTNLPMTAVAAVLLLFVAFLAKMSFYWVLPLWAVALIGDFRRDRMRLLIRRFYAPAFVTGLILTVSYFVICQAIWGDPFARFKAIQALSGHHLWSWERSGLPALLKRLTIGPPLLFVRYYGPLIFLAIPACFLAPRSLRPWLYYTAFCVFFFWFGTTSFTGYEPMPLLDRMTLPALPGILVLASFTAARVSILSERKAWGNSILSLVVVFGMAGLPFAAYVNASIGRPASEADAMALLRQEVESHPNRQYLLVCSDGRSPSSLAFYFGYRYPDNLRAARVEDLDSKSLGFIKTFVFVHRERSAFLKAAYGSRHFDDEIGSLGLPVVYQSGYVTLYVSETGAELRGLVDSVHEPQDR